MYFVKILRNSVRKNPEAEYNEFFELVKEGTCTLSSIYLM